MIKIRYFTVFTPRDQCDVELLIVLTVKVVNVIQDVDMALDGRTKCSNGNSFAE